MKNNLQPLAKIFFLCSFFFVLVANAQAPEKMSYQAVIRNASNALVTNQSIGMRVSILKTTATGTTVYQETHTTTTNANGLASIEIGGGTVVSGTFATIDWSADKYFVKTETDPAGGTNYTITGTSQLLSTSYALFAKKAGNGVPNGGTTGQILSKVDGADYNTAWVTPSGSGPTLQLMASKTTGNTTQLSAANGTNTGDNIIFNNVTTSPTSGIGSYDATTGIFTVGTNGAGVYEIQARTQTTDYSTASNTIGSWIYIEVNGSSWGSANNVYPPYIASAPNNLAAGMRGNPGFVIGVLKLNAGDTFRIKGLASNSSAASLPNYLKVDGSCNMTVVKLN